MWHLSIIRNRRVRLHCMRGRPCIHLCVFGHGVKNKLMEFNACGYTTKGLLWRARTTSSVDRSQTTRFIFSSVLLRVISDISCRLIKIQCFSILFLSLFKMWLNVDGDIRRYAKNFCDCSLKGLGAVRTFKKSLYFFAFSWSMMSRKYYLKISSQFNE